MSMRIGGLASGLDTDTIIKQLMSAERVKYDKYTQNKQTNVWKQEAYNDINKNVANFIIDSKKSFGINFGGSVASANWIKKATSSNEDVLTAKSMSGAPSGSHTVKVHQLAEGVNIASNNKITFTNKDGKEEKATYSTKLSAIGFSGDVKFNVNGQEISLKSTETLGDLTDKINAKSKDTGVKANFDYGSGRMFLSTTTTGSDAKINITGNADVLSKLSLPTGNNENVKLGDIFDGAKDVKFNYNGNDVTLNADSTISDVVKSLKDMGVDAEFKDGKLNIVNSVNISVNGSNMSKENFMKKINISELNAAGKDAIIDFDGAKNIRYSSNQFTINDISIDLKKADPGKEITLKVDTDVDSVMKKITDFVESYNKLVEDTGKKTTEKKYRDYKPLTDEQKEAMKEDDIKKWEEKSKSGLLKNDQYVNNMLQTVRTGLYESVKDKDGNKIPGKSSIFDIGITTGEYKDKGKLVIDEKKLREAVEKDVDGVVNLLFSTSSVTEAEAQKDPEKAKERKSQTGLFNRMFDDFTDGMKTIIDKAGPGDNSALYRSVKSNIMVDFVTKGSKSLIDEDILTIDKMIAKEQDRLVKKEDFYYKKYTALETAMNKMNSQMSWLTGQLGQ